MSIAVHPGFLPAAECKVYADGLSTTAGWTFSSQYQITHDLSPTDPILVSIQKLVPIPPENRVISNCKLICSFEKCASTFDDRGHTVMLFVEGDWRGLCNGRSYNFCPGDVVVVSKLTMQLESFRRGKRWIVATQTISDLGMATSTLTQALSGIIGQIVQVSIGPDPNAQDDDDDDEDDLSDDPLDEDLSDAESVQSEDAPEPAAPQSEA